MTAVITVYILLSPGPCVVASDSDSTPGNSHDPPGADVLCDTVVSTELLVVGVSVELDTAVVLTCAVLGAMSRGFAVVFE